MASTIPESWPFVPPNLSSWKRQSCRKTSISPLIKSEQYCQSHLFTSVVQYYQYYQYSPFWSFLHICGQGPLPSAVDMSTATAASLRLGAIWCQFKWVQDGPGWSRMVQDAPGQQKNLDGCREHTRFMHPGPHPWIRSSENAYFQSEKTMLLYKLYVGEFGHGKSHFAR